ncbi:MAG: SOS response-associated peptidase [Ekhidna sp.]
MLDRYTITLSHDELALVLGVDVADSYKPLYNAAPTKSLPVISNTEPKQVSFQTWGFMTQWSNNRAMSPKFFNLPVDAALNKAGNRKKLVTNRCLIPMDGFYVWKQVAKKQKIPYYFFFPDKKVFWVAGLWEEDDERQRSFIMITQPSNDYISDFQEDMPFIISPSLTKNWLQSSDQNELSDILKINNNFEFASHAVSPRIADIEKNDASLIKPTPPADQHGNYTLFS